LNELYSALLRALVIFHERAIFEAQVQYLEHLSYAAGERGVFVAHLLARASSPAALQRILPRLEGEGAPSEDRWVCDFFVRHTRHAGAEFHPLFSVARSGRAFSLLAELVWRLSPAQPDVWLSLIERTSADSALALLAFLQGRADAALMEPIYRHASGHPDPSLRHTTISAIPLRDSAGRVQPVLLDALRDPSAYVRVAAIQRLADSGEPALGIFLVEHLQHPSFLRAQPEEQQALLRGLLQLGQDRHTPLLLQQLDHWERGLARPASSESLANLKRVCEQVLWALSQHRSEASFQRLYERAALAPDELFQAYQRALESFAEHAAQRQRTPAPAVSGRSTFLEQSSLALSFQDDPEPSLVLTPARSMKAHNIDALLHAYLQDDAAMMDLLPEEPLPVDDAPSLPLTPPHAIEEMLREYLGVPQGEQASHELPVPPLADAPQRLGRAKGRLTSPPDLLLHELLDASPSPNFLDISPHEGTWGADSAPTLLPGRAKRYARSPEDSDLPDFGLGFGVGGDDLSPDHAKWLDEFTDPELDDEVSSLIDDLMDEPPPKKKSP
jgi:signal transduction histidine kinase